MILVFAKKKSTMHANGEGRKVIQLKNIAAIAPKIANIHN